MSDWLWAELVAAAFDVGAPTAPLTRVEGGVSHAVCRLSTDTGQYAAKRLNVVAESWWWDAYRAAARIERLAAADGVRLAERLSPMVAALDLGRTRHYWQLHRWHAGPHPVAPTDNQAARNDDLASRDLGPATRGGGLAARNDDLASRDLGPATRGGGLAVRNDDLASRDLGPATRGGGLAVRNDDLASRDLGPAARGGDLAARGGGLATRDDGSAARDRGLATRGGDLAARDDGSAARNLGPAARGGDLAARGGGSATRDDGSAARDRGLATRGGDLAARDDGSAARNLGPAARGGDLAARGGGSATRDDGSAARDRGLATRGGDLAARDDGSAARDRGLATQGGDLAARDDGSAARDLGPATRGGDLAARGDGLATRDDGSVVRGDGRAARAEGLIAPADGLVPRADELIAPADGLVPRADELIAPADSLAERDVDRAAWTGDQTAWTGDQTAWSGDRAARTGDRAAWSGDLAGWTGETLALLHARRSVGPAVRPVLHPLEAWHAWLDEHDGRDSEFVREVRGHLPTVAAALEHLAQPGPPLTPVDSHRDVKPDNVVLTASGPILLDWDSAGPDLAEHELVRSALAMGFEARKPFARTIKSYLRAGGCPIPSDPAVFHGIVEAQLQTAEWLLWRALGHRGDDRAGRALAAAECLDRLRGAAKSLRRIPEWSSWLASAVRG
ncbi:hypothetical protein [Dactylosporangium sp. CS-033363]|uniref:hypothetical protein n=1 Tax=Dactylosporangium sp. CS-033363 TaxID=3239935 RepID=UPI003D8CE1E0